MDRELINSTMIVSIGYDMQFAILEIEFRKGGSIWQYYDFPEYSWNEFHFCESHGKYFLANIKNQYREVRVG
jgi:hypothetical protein